MENQRISVIDDLLDREFFTLAEYWLSEQALFEPQEHGGKTFWVVPAPACILEPIINVLRVRGERIDYIHLAFFRQATQDTDTDWRIHCDSQIDGSLPRRACVFYLTVPPTDPLAGTAFWRHHLHGEELEIYSAAEHDRLLLKDANDLSCWDLRQVVPQRPNRAVCYDTSLFHSKYPNVQAGVRNVLVIFYS
jgi:hypothetical protein